ncbi:MAG: exodeoxyribonuclease VII large subunit [Limisphaerales bacterium]
MNREQQSQWEFGDLFEHKSEPPAETKKVYSVAELNRRARNLLENQLGDVWVEGEVSGLRHHSSGHSYFAIKDESGQVSCALFRGTSSENRTHLKDGAMVLVQAQVTIYEPRGQYQLIVRKVELQGRGALQAKYEQLKAKLNEEGLFSAERKRALPEYPARVGIVTSPTGAALRDVLHVIERRNRSLELVLEPCRVQGEGAADEMVYALRRLNHWSHKNWDALDLILLTRGGGSLEDLWAFNEEPLARAIAASKLPVVSAVGHEIDFMISDLVADVRAATPSAAAELITEGVFASREFLGRSLGRLLHLAGEKIGLAKREFGHISHRLGQAHPRRKLFQSCQRVDELSATLHRLAKSGMEGGVNRLQHCRKSLELSRPDKVVSQFQNRLAWLVERVNAESAKRFNAHCADFEKQHDKLQLLSPDNVLSRGYSITSDFDTGEIVRDVSKLEVGQKLATRLTRGTVISTVEELDD